MKDAILKANMSMDFVVSPHTRKRWTLVCQKLVVDLFQRTFQQSWDMFIEAVSLICMSSTPCSLYITPFWQWAGMTQSHKVLHLKEGENVQKKNQTRSSRSWIRGQGSQVSHISVSYTKSEVQTNYTENQGFYSVTSEVTKQTNSAYKWTLQEKVKVTSRQGWQLELTMGKNQHLPSTYILHFVDRASGSILVW
jgi:hypothetical protein